MAETLKHWPPELKRHRYNPYPWRQWLDGKARKFAAGVDFFTSAKAFQCCARMAARRLGVKVHSARMDQGKFVIIQATKESNRG